MYNSCRVVYIFKSNEFYNGSIFVPSYMVAPTAVTEENLDDVIIQSGFHSSIEVYRNISEKQDK